MPETSSAHRALSASTLALVVACGSMVPFVPPMLEATITSIPRMVLLGCAIAVGMFLHWIFLGIAARRLERSVPGWTLLALLFPIGGIVALILLGHFGDEDRRQPATSTP